MGVFVGVGSHATIPSFRRQCHKLQSPLVCLLFVLWGWNSNFNSIREMGIHTVRRPFVLQSLIDSIKSANCSRGYHRLPSTFPILFLMCIDFFLFFFLKIYIYNGNRKKFLFNTKINLEKKKPGEWVEKRHHRSLSSRLGGRCCEVQNQSERFYDAAARVREREGVLCVSIDLFLLAYAHSLSRRNY